MEDANTTYPNLDSIGLVVNPLVEIDRLNSLLDLHSTSNLEFEECENRATEYAVQLREQIKQHEEQLESLLARVTEIKRSANKLKASLKILRSHQEELRKELTDLETNTDSKNQVFSTEFLSYNLTQLIETVKLFERLFGFVAERTKSDMLQLLFHGCALSQNSTTVCICRLRYTKLGRFESVNCNPPIPDFERLVNHLNVTKDMRSFLIVLRHRFQRYFELARVASKRLST